MALVVLLRGINVGGHRTFRPTMLAERLKHLDAVNIGAAGTFVIRRPVAKTKLRTEIARWLPFDAEIMICQGREIVELMARNPFADQPVRPDITHFVSVMSKRPRSALSTPMSFPSDGEWLLKILAVENRFVFGVYRRHMRVIGHLGKLDRILGVPVTTRSWKTIATVAKVLADRGSCRRDLRQHSIMPGIRRFQPHEWQLYRELRLAALRDAPYAFGSTLVREEAFPEEEWITRLAGGTASPLNYPMLAEDDSGRAVGLGWVRVEPTDTTTATLYQVWIDPSARRRHIGQALLASAVRWGREAGARVMELHVALGPESAMAFYRRAGFVEAGACSPLRPGSEQLQQPMRLFL